MLSKQLANVPENHLEPAQMRMDRFIFHEGKMPSVITRQEVEGVEAFLQQYVDTRMASFIYTTTAHLSLQLLRNPALANRQVETINSLGGLNLTDEGHLVAVLQKVGFQEESMGDVRLFLRRLPQQ